MKKFECKQCEPAIPCVIEWGGSTAPMRCPFDGIKVEWSEVNHLPKLTAEALKERGIEWPDWSNGASVDKGGRAIFFAIKPHEIDELRQIWCTAGKYVVIPGKWDNSDWQNSLIERPAVVKQNLTTEQPEWCKVGEWVYHIALNQYAKIRELTSDGFIAEDGTAFRLCDPDYFKPARVRRWNKDEMRQQAGKTFVLNGYNAVCLAATGTKLFFLDTMGLRHCISYSSETIKFWRNTMLDGSPCGVLEVAE